MSAVFSTASHCVLQYLPAVVWHEQTGCAHFTGFVAVIFSPSSHQVRKIRVAMVPIREKSCCPQKNTFLGTPLAGLLLYAGLLVSVELFPASRSTSLLGTGVRCSELDMLRVKQLLRYS